MLFSDGCLFRSKAVCSLLVLSLFASGCSATPQSVKSLGVQSSPLSSPSPLPVALEQSTSGEASGNADILQAIAPAVVVYLAETHTDAADHVAQMEIVAALAAQHEIAIALEMFQRPFQPVLEAYLAGELSEEQLIAQSEYETRWGYDWEFYAPILRYAKANQIPLIALNTPAEVTRKVAREGLASLEGEDLDDIPPLADIDTEDPDYRQRLMEVFKAHGGAGHSLEFENFFAAQVLWDETMAEHIVEQLTAEPTRQIIVLVGEGHIAYDHGIPSRVMRRLPQVAQVSVRLVPDEAEIEPDFADFTWLTGAQTSE